jgi:small subunit ribosomal protein S1
VKESQPSAGKVDLSSLSSMLSAHWKGNAPGPSDTAEPLQTGQIRTFRITALDATAKSLTVEVA